MLSAADVAECGRLYKFLRDRRADRVKAHG